MKKHLLAGLVLASISANAYAAANLVSATVDGTTSGARWDTPTGGAWTLFLQQPGPGDYLNPSDEGVNDPTALGANNFLLLAEGWGPTESLNSDAVYLLTLAFADGATLTGQYSSTLNSFLEGSSTTLNGVHYALEEFSFTRFLGNPVSGFSATSGGDPNDYAGSFRFTAADVTSPVPEPATWALMLVGFGAVGYSMRHSKGGNRRIHAI
jgi:hypothetical protein